MRLRALPPLVAVLVMAGCASSRAPVARPATEPPKAAATPELETTTPRHVDENIADRIVAVVNNDAITLSELQESVAIYRYENRDRAAASDEELYRMFLTRMIDSRLQLQEAEREKITVEDNEVEEEMRDRMTRLGAKSMAELEAMVKAEGVSMASLKNRMRDALRINKVVRRKVALRISVTEAEVDQYVADNREKLETGLGYHARHILIAPAGPADADWEAARIRAEMVRARLADGADFAELARQHSKDASAKDGGDLGTLKRGELAQDIETQILALEPGQVSRPYRSSLGYHVFRLEAKDSLQGEGLQRVRQQVKEILFRQKYEVRLEAWLKEIKQRAIIEVRI
jgi:peptidyl-prolyl cis-trans isomerase SurA